MIEKIEIPKLILISGNGRNSGKTTLAELIVAYLAQEHPVNGIKISPHLHGVTTEMNSNQMIFGDNNLRIYRETDPGTAKDSSRMLRAGCQNVWFIIAGDEFLLQALNLVLTKTTPGDLLICESPALIRFITPGLFFFMKGNQGTKKAPDRPDIGIHTATLKDLRTPERWIYPLINRWLEAQF